MVPVYCRKSATFACDIFPNLNEGTQMLRILYSWPSLLSLSVALSIAISHVMQLGNAPLTASLLERADATETSELTNISYTAAFDVDRQDTSVIVPETTAPTYARCTPIVETAHLAEATIEMSVTAPCHANKRFSVHHNGLMLGSVSLYTSPSPRDGLLSRMPSSA